MLRHQLNVYARRQAKPRLRPMDRFRWAGVCRIWPWMAGDVDVLQASDSDRLATQVYWALSRKKGSGRGSGRPPVPKEVHDLIMQLSSANIGWGVPRIAGELRKLGTTVCGAFVSLCGHCEAAVHCETPEDKVR